MKFISFTSGSCGNCCWFGTERGGIIVDAGASMRRVRRLMMDNSLPYDNVEALLVTHEHLDHIRFLGTFCKYMKPRVCAPARLHGVLARHPFTKDHIADCRVVLDEGWNEISDFEIRWFSVPHDAAQTVGYAVRSGERMLVLMTDLEHVPGEAMELAREADTVVIESNYDPEMLAGGPYPPELKQRILKEGHLSNDACASAIREFWHPGLRNLFLCHLSGNNNTPSLAYASALKALDSAGAPRGSVNLRTLERGVPSPVINL